MSKSKGNVTDPWDILNSHGADAFRWYLYTASPPGEPRRFSKDLVGETVSKFWLTLWNTYSFFVTYANIDGWTPSSPHPSIPERDPLDRYILAELHQLVKQVTVAFEEYDVPGATRPVQNFVEILSNWYVRLSRRRFWKSEGDIEKLSAYATLYECLVTIANLIAPTAPFMADTLYRNLVASTDPKAPISVHLERWATYDESLIDATSIKEMRLVQRLVSLGRAARESVRIGVRQPLARALFSVREAGDAEIVKRHAGLIASELNVKSVEVMGNAADFVEYKLNPLPSVLGKKFGKDFPSVQKTLREGSTEDVRRWAEMLLRGEDVTVALNGQSYTVTPAECEVKRIATEGYAVADEGGYLAALDTTITEVLEMEGLAREVVRRVQAMRKDADFNITDHIVLRYNASDKLAKAISQFNDYIAAETLATTIEQGEPENGFFRADFAPDPEGDAKKDTSIDGERLALGVKRT
jgi:isoleucyl-tRNA synthetase